MLTILEPSLKELTGEIYRLPTKAVTSICRGANVTFKVETDTEDFYLRVYREDRPKTDIEAEIMALDGFHNTHEVQVSKPVEKADGGYIWTYPYQGVERHAVLFTAAEGEQLSTDIADLKKLGKALAILHREMKSPVGKVFNPDCICDVDQILSKRGEDFCEIRAELNQVIPELLHRIKQPSRVGFCHGDVWQGNARFNGKQTIFFDFEDCMDGPIALDLARQVGWLWGDDDYSVAKVDAFLGAYNELTALDENDMAIIPALAQWYEIFMFRFLAKYCDLAPELWRDAIDHLRKGLKSRRNRI